MEELDEFGNIIKEFESMKETGKCIGCCEETIRKHLKINSVITINNHIIRRKIYDDLEDEIWKFVNTIYDEINSKYLISNKGRVKNINGDILNPQEREGYWSIGFSSTINGKSIQIHEYIHRLMAFAFQEYTDRKHEVNHIKKDTSNNIIENLEILSKQLHSEKDHGRPILGVSEFNRFKYVTFPSAASAGKVFGISGTSIAGSMRRNTTNVKRYGTCKGYIWYYLDSIEARTILSLDEYIDITFTIITSTLDVNSNLYIAPKPNVYNSFKSNLYVVPSPNVNINYAPRVNISSKINNIRNISVEIIPKISINLVSSPTVNIIPDHIVHSLLPVSKIDIIHDTNLNNIIIKKKTKNAMIYTFIGNSNSGFDFDSSRSLVFV
jgi:hypothetical protein